MLDTASFIQGIAIWGVPALLAITVHEAAHGYVAFLKGDRTAWMLGRVTLNPFKHIDPLGTILLPLLTLATAGLVFGYAKPVPVSFSRLRNVRWDSLWVALAGPGANLILALLSIGGLWLALLLPETLQFPFIKMMGASVIINSLLMLFNLLPLLPLDGGRMLQSLLPRHLAWKYAQTERYGMIIVLILLVTGVLFRFITPLLNGMLAFLDMLSPVSLFILLNNL